MKKILLSTAFTCLAVPALAQDAGVCGQPVALSQPMSAAVKPGFADISQVLTLRRGEPAYVELDVQETTEITFETMTRDVDPVLALFDASGQVLTWDDDSAGDLDARVARMLEPGRYCVQARTISADPAETRVVLLGYEGVPPDPAAAEAEALAARCATAPELATGAAVTGTVDASGGAPYRMTFAEDGPLRLEARSQAIDTILQLLDADGTLIAENDDHADMPGTDSLIETRVAAGDYCVLVTGYSESQGAFSLQASASDMAAPVPDGVEDLGLLADLPLEHRVLGADAVLAVAFTLDAPARVAIEPTVAGASTLSVSNDAGEQSVDLEAGMPPVELDLDAGRHVVILQDADDLGGLRVRGLRITRN